MKKYWLGVLAGMLFATAASAQAPMPKPKMAACQPAAAASTQEILNAEFGLVVLQLKEPLTQNVFRPASFCPDGKKWRCSTICTKWIGETCVAWQEYNCGCE